MVSNDLLGADIKEVSVLLLSSNESGDSAIRRLRLDVQFCILSEGIERPEALEIFLCFEFEISLPVVFTTVNDGHDIEGSCCSSVRFSSFWKSDTYDGNKEVIY